MFLFSIVAITSVAVFMNTGRLPEFVAIPVLADVFTENNEEVVPVWGQVTDNAVEENEAGETDTNTNLANISPGQEAFSVFPFYIAENAQAYTEFQMQNPQMSAETVVWKVNAFLHLPHYSYIIINYDVNPLLVNPVFRLPYGFTPAVLLPVYAGNMELLATPATIDAFQRMRLSAQGNGLDLAVVSAYRPATRQAYLFDRQGRVDGVVARPYHSEHQTGRALDLWGPGGLLDGGGGPPSPTGIWVRENAHNYGFIVRYTEENTHITGFIHEPWHITYVSYEIAQHIINNNLSSLEEFVARYPWWALP